MYNIADETIILRQKNFQNLNEHKILHIFCNLFLFIILKCQACIAVWASCCQDKFFTKILAKSVVIIVIKIHKNNGNI